MPPAFAGTAAPGCTSQKRKARLSPGFLFTSLWSSSSRVSNRVMVFSASWWGSSLTLSSYQTWSDQVLRELDQVGQILRVPLVHVRVLVLLVVLRLPLGRFLLVLHLPLGRVLPLLRLLLGCRNQASVSSATLTPSTALSSFLSQDPSVADFHRAAVSVTLPAGLRPRSQGAAGATLWALPCSPSCPQSACLLAGSGTPAGPRSRKPPLYIRDEKVVPSPLSRVRRFFVICISLFTPYIYRGKALKNVKTPRLSAGQVTSGETGGGLGAPNGLVRRLRWSGISPCLDWTVDYPGSLLSGPPGGLSR